MNKYLAIPIFILSWTSGLGQDLIVIRSGDSLIGQIVYESPKHFRIKHISGTARDNHGAAASISRDQVIYVRDSLPAYKLHKFGKIKIYSIHSDKYIHKPFYTANNSSITYISSIKNLRGKGWVYGTIDIPIADIEKIRWHYSSAGVGIVIGGVLGGVIGAVVGGFTTDKPDIYSSVSTYLVYGTEVWGKTIVGGVGGAVGGAIIGGGIQAAVTKYYEIGTAWRATNMGAAKTSASADKREDSFC